MEAFTLTAADFDGPNEWLWRLTDAAGRSLGTHTVKLDPSAWQYAAYLDLGGYLRQHAVPDKLRESETGIIRQVGQWIGEQVLGQEIGNALVAAAAKEPVTVRVTVAREEDAPDGDEHHILFRPLELAHAGPHDRPLAVQDVSLVFDSSLALPSQSARAAGSDQASQAAPLRMLAVFSLPLGVGALNLRHERYHLRKMLQAIAADRGLDLELRVLQYGVTREALKEMLREGPGWDVLHFSGHGLASRLVLEKADGTQDVVETTELLDLIKPTRQRLKWITLSACLSAAATIDETLRWLGIDPRRHRDPGSSGAAETESGDEETARRMPVLAQTLSDALDCAVLAMRFPVGDQFAIDLGRHVYKGMLSKEQPLDRALQLTLSDLVGDSASAYPPLSIATPALFGGRAAGLMLSPAEKTTAQVTGGGPGMAHFPPAEPHFVGRVAEMSQASQALASQSNYGGVLLHGMAGAGKSACAKELAWQHEDLRRFRYFVWYKAPDVGKDVTGSLLGFATALETQVPGLQLVHLVDRPDELRRYLPQLAFVLQKNSVLIVLDNLESLLIKTPKATDWHEPAWGDVIDALLSHDGESRVVLTSRLRPPVGESRFAREAVAAGRPNPQDRLLIRAVHALSLDEAALLARQLPNLGRILEGGHAADGHQQEAHRQLVARMLRLVQGHPKLLDLAEGQSADPASLDSHLDRAQAATLAGARPLAAFFETGRSALEEEDFLATLSGWTKAIATSLPDDARRLFGFLCCLEEDDRVAEIVSANWQDFLDRLAQNGDGVAEVERSEPPADTSEPNASAESGGSLHSTPATRGLSFDSSDSESPMTEAEFAELLAGIDPNDPAALAKLLEHPFVQQQMQQTAERQASASASLAETLETLYVVGLVERKWGKLPACHEPGGSGADRKLEAYATYGIHPGVAEAGRKLARAEVQQAVDAELGAYWITAFDHGIQTEMQGGGGLIRLAGMRAAPYLMRASRWEEASTLLEQVLGRDQSPATVAALLPLLRHIAVATEGTPRELIQRGPFANALLAAGRWQEAEAMMLEIAAQAEQQGQFRVATAMLGQVINIMRATGRAEAALEVVERKKQATKSADLGPWTQLGDECTRLQLLGQLGRHEEVLAEVQRHRETINRLSLCEGSAGEDKDENPAEKTGESGAGDTDADATFAERKATIEEAVVAWNVRETLLDTGRSSAMRIERWDEALALNAEVQAVERSRHASELEQAGTRYNDYGPLLRLERFDDASRLLLDCRRVYEEHNAIPQLGKVFGALADLESQLGHFDRAAEAGRNSLRYTYLAGDPGPCAISHFNLANYLAAAASRGTGAGSPSHEETALAHRLAAALIRLQTQDHYTVVTLQALAHYLTTLAPDSPARGLTVADGSGFDTVVAIVEQIEGVRFTELFATLPTTRAASGQEALAQVLALASRQEEETESGGEMPAEMQALLAPLFAAAEAGEDLQPHLVAIRQQLLQDAPDQAAAIDQFLQQLTETLRLNDE